MASSARASELIAALGMRPHPEGGHYAEIHRSRALTSIFFMLTSGEISRWHRVIGSDESWHFYEGDCLELLTAGRDFERLDRHVLGPVDGPQRPAHVVGADVWQAARTLGAYTLVGCTVGPGFDFANFEMLRDNSEMSARARTRHPSGAAFI